MSENKTKNKKKNDRLINAVLGVMLVLGLGLLVYPTFANWWNSFHQSRAVASYMKAVANLDPEEYDKVISEAEAYNGRLAMTGILWNMNAEQLEEYNRILDITGTGIMGYIDIPKASVTLPIYHGSDEAVLQVAIGHLEGTSLPVGGASSHCVVTGHRGLPSARLFTDIDKLVKGDTFTISVMNRTLTYEVDDIHIVEPREASQVEEGEVIAFMSNGSVITHRVVENLSFEGEFVTKGDANLQEDMGNVPYDHLIGVVIRHYKYLGDVLQYLTTTAGKVYLLLVVGCGIMLNMIAGRLRES